MRPSLALVMLLAASGCFDPAPRETPPPPTAPAVDPRFDLVPFVEGLDRPVDAVEDPQGRILFVEQGGRVRVWHEGQLRPEPYLDLTGRVSTGYEQGLLSIALAPDYNATGRVFVSYTDTSGDSQLVRYFRHPLNPAMLDPLTARTFLTVDQPYANHNGGLARFGPDGYLWFGLGDGGSAGDPHNHGQDPGTLLGALLRIDVSGEDYTIPPNNPFVGGGGRGEVWAYGLRNPWRFSFDRDTGDLYIADVGQNRWEEVNYEANGTGGGRNYGWSGYEGNEVFRSTRTAADAVFPVATYRLGDGNCSVTGGYAYRGQDVPGLRGVYLFADYCSGRLWGLWGENGTWRQELVKETGHRVAAFAQLSSGELLLLDHAGTAYRIAAPAAG